MASNTSNPLASIDDLEAGPVEAEPQQEQGDQRIADVAVVQSQLRFLARLHKPDGSGVSVVAYVGYAVLLISWYVAPALWGMFSHDGSTAVCGEGRIELDGTGAVELMHDDSSLCHGGNHSFSYASSGIVHASAVCEAVGARLCTLEEVAGGDLHDTGCWVDGAPSYTWTSSTMNAAGEDCPAGQHISAVTDPNWGDNNPPRCTLDTDDLQVFCCADARINSRTTCPAIEASGDTSSWPERCTSAKSCEELTKQWPEGVWRLTGNRTNQAWATVCAFMYCPMTLAIWAALIRVSKPGCGEMHALLGGVERLSDGEVAAIRWWRNVTLGVTVPLSGLLILVGLGALTFTEDLNLDALAFFFWFMAVFCPVSFLAGSLWILTLKTASVAGCHAVGTTEDLVTSWVARLPRPKQLAPGAQDDLSTHAGDLMEQIAQCVDEIGTAIVELNAERVPQLGEGWGFSIAISMLGSIGVFIMTIPNVIRHVAAARTDIQSMALDGLLAVFFGVLPLVLLALPASVTDKCIALETRLSDLLIPNDPHSKAKKGHYVVSFETSQQLQILEKYMRESGVSCL